MEGPTGEHMPRRLRVPRRLRRPLRGRRPGIPLVLTAASVLAGSLLAACSSATPDAGPHSGTNGAATTTSTTAAATPAAATGPACPLTGLPAPGGAVPQRSALAVKVDNYPTARPQTGLTAADVVFEEPVEGGITRYVAVFQCHGTASVGPVRSARNIDIGILGQLGQPLLVHVGGIQPVINNILASPLKDFELGDYTTVIQHPAGRYAPYDTYTSTTAVWHMRPTADTPPAPLFTYSRTVPSGTPVSSISVPFSFYSPVTWRWDATKGVFLRYFKSTPDLLSNGVQNSATNVVVQFVNVFYGPWVENTQGGLEVQANLYTNASGTALIFRNGEEVQARWSRSTLGQPTSFTTTSGTPVALEPGTTWVELVPSTIQVTPTP